MEPVVDDWDQTLESLAHGFSEHILVLLLVLAAHSHLCSVRHAAQQLKGADRALPLARLPTQVGRQHGKQTDDERLGLELLEERVERVVGRLSHVGALVRQGIESDGDQTGITQEDDLADALLLGEPLQQGAEDDGGDLAPLDALLVRGCLSDLFEDAISLQASKANGVEQQIGQGVGSVEDGLRRLGGEDGVEQGRDVLLRRCNAGRHRRLRDHSWCERGRDLVWHLEGRTKALHWLDRDSRPS